MAIEPREDFDSAGPDLYLVPQPQSVKIYVIKCVGEVGAKWPNPVWCHIQARDLDTLADMYRQHIEAHHPDKTLEGDYYRMTYGELVDWFTKNC